MPALSKEDKLRLLTTMLESRHADLREQNLIRQGKGHFHVSGMGHEALAAVSIQMEPGDYIVSYYRDRGLILGRGMTTRQLGLEYFAKRNTGSGGRQMPSHYSNADLHIWSVPTPTGSQLLPACGIAWGIQLDGKKNLVVTTVGDAEPDKAISSRLFLSQKKKNCLFSSSLKTTAMASACPHGRRIRSCSACFKPAIGSKSMVAMSRNSTTQQAWRWRESVLAKARRFSGLRWSGFPVTPVRTTKNFIAARKNYGNSRNAIH